MLHRVFSSSSASATLEAENQDRQQSCYPRFSATSDSPLFPFFACARASSIQSGPLWHDLFVTIAPVTSPFLRKHPWHRIAGRFRRSNNHLTLTSSRAHRGSIASLAKRKQRRPHTFPCIAMRRPLRLSESRSSGASASRPFRSIDGIIRAYPSLDIPVLRLVSGTTRCGAAKLAARNSAAASAYLPCQP